MHESYDWGYGGWGDAPKFPQAMALEFLIHHSTSQKTNEYAKLIKYYLYAMARGGMYDGGWRRFLSLQYHNQRRVPHYEK